MSKASQYQGLALLLTLFLFCFGVHFWLTDRKGTLRAVYPVPAMLSALTVRCSEGASVFLQEMAYQGIWELRTLSSQLAYVDRSGNLYHCESGWKSNPLLSARVTKTSRFRYGSMTKPITSAALLKLFEDQNLTINAPAIDFLYEKKNIEPPKDKRVKRLTVEQLMTHRTGLVGNVFSTRERPWCPYEMSEFLNVALLPEPSVGVKYSNLGYCILGQIISQQSKEGYRETVASLFDLERRGVKFAGSDPEQGEVWHDYRYNDMYSQNSVPNLIIMRFPQRQV